MLANCAGIYINPFVVESIDTDEDGDIVIVVLHGDDLNLAAKTSPSIKEIGEAVCKELSRQMSDLKIMAFEEQALKLRLALRYHIKD